MAWGTFGSQCVIWNCREEQGQIGGRKAMLLPMFWGLQESGGRAVGLTMASPGHSAEVLCHIICFLTGMVPLKYSS